MDQDGGSNTDPDGGSNSYPELKRPKIGKIINAKNKN
jgi:hypothetical protein